MSLLKDLWIEETERQAARLEDLGVPWDEAFDKACDVDYTDKIRDCLADIGDSDA